MFNEKEVLIAEYLGLINDLENAGYSRKEIFGIVTIQVGRYKNPKFLMEHVSSIRLKDNIANLKAVKESKLFKSRKSAVGGSVEQLFKDVLSLRNKMPYGFLQVEGNRAYREVKNRLKYSTTHNKSVTIWNAVALRDKMIAYLAEQEGKEQNVETKLTFSPTQEVKTKTKVSETEMDINSLIDNCIQLTGMNQWELSSEIGKGKHFIKNLREGKYSNNQMLVDEAVISLQEVLAEAKKSSVIVACEEKNTEYLEQINKLQKNVDEQVEYISSLKYEIEEKDKQIASNVEIVNGLEADRNFAEKQRGLAQNTIAKQAEIITGVRKDLSELKGQMLHKDSIKTLWKLSTSGLSMILLTILCLHLISH